MKILLDIAPAQDKYCGNGTGKFCPFMYKRKIGTIAVCSVFNQDLPVENNKLARLEECVSLTLNDNII